MNSLNTILKCFVELNLIKRMVYVLSGVFTLYVMYRFLTIQDLNNPKEVLNVLALLVIGFPFGILFKKLHFHLSFERNVKKLQYLTREELFSEKGRKYRLLDREAFEHVVNNRIYTPES